MRENSVIKNISDLVEVKCNICADDNTVCLFRKGIFNIVKCMNCGLVYVNPRPSDKRLKEKYGKDYYYSAAGIPISKQLTYQDFFKTMRDCAIDGKNLLDVGCGTGEFLDLAYKQGWQPKGVETSEYAVNYAKGNYNIEVFSDDLGDVRFPDKYFDVITMWDSIEHLPDPRKELSEINRILKTGGLVYISTTNLSGFSQKLFGTTSNQFCPEEHIYYFTPGTAARLLKDCGFSQVKVKTQHIFIFNVIFFYIKKMRKKHDHNDIRQGYNGFLSFIQNNRVIPPIIKTINSFLNFVKMGDQIIIYARKVNEKRKG